MYSDKSVLSEKLRDMPIGDTPDGANWAIKALHPADHEAVPRGMPTHDATSVVTMQFQREFLISPPEGLPTDTWDLDLWITRDPLLFGTYQLTDAAGGSLVYGTCENRQLGPDWANALVKLKDLCEAYRVSYMGATGHLVAPALADQGTVRAAQYEYPAYLRPYVPANASNLMTTNVVTYPDPLLPYGSLIQMPNAYENVAKRGFYMPMKLTEADKSFIRTNQLCILSGRDITNGQTAATEYTPGNRWPWFSQTEGIVFGYKPGDLIGHVAFRGISKQASINLIFRVGVDMKVRPETTYSPFNHEPPVYDATAIKMYFEIARRMADAYPASYNSTGQLLQVVAAIAQQLWPLVEPHARKLLDSLTSKINAKVQQAVNKRAGGGGGKGAAAAEKKAAKPNPGKQAKKDNPE